MHIIPVSTGCSPEGADAVCVAEGVLPAGTGFDVDADEVDPDRKVVDRVVVVVLPLVLTLVNEYTVVSVLNSDDAMLGEIEVVFEVARATSISVALLCIVVCITAPGREFELAI